MVFFTFPSLQTADPCLLLSSRLSSRILHLSAMNPRFPSQSNGSINTDSQPGRPSSAPPPSSSLPQRARSQPAASVATTTSLAPHIYHRVLTESATSPASPQDLLPSLDPVDLMSQLHRSGPTVVKSRTGSVLSRGFILKTDHYPSGTFSIWPSYDLPCFQTKLNLCNVVGQAELLI